MEHKHYTDMIFLIKLGILSSLTYHYVRVQKVDRLKTIVFLLMLSFGYFVLAHHGEIYSQST